MKKGRHRRFEEARALKQMSDNFDALFEPEDAERIFCKPGSAGLLVVSLADVLGDAPLERFEPLV